MSKILRNLSNIDRVVALCANWHSLGRFTRYDFVACDKFTTGLRQELFLVNQNYNSLTTVVYVTKNVVGIIGIGNVE